MKAIKALAARLESVEQGNKPNSQIELFSVDGKRWLKITEPKTGAVFNYPDNERLDFESMKVTVFEVP